MFEISKWKLDPRESKRSKFKLMGAAEDCKHVLSTLATAHVFIESLHEGFDLSANVSRARIDMLVTQLLPSFIEPIDDVFAQAGLTSADIHKVFIGPYFIKIMFRVLTLVSICAAGYCVRWSRQDAATPTGHQGETAHR